MTLKKSLPKKIVKSFKNAAGSHPVIYFEDGSQLNIYLDDQDELILELIGSET
jgi:hypothetical protein